MNQERTLSDDVRLMGDTLGEVLRAHGGEELFQHVEAMRVAAKTAREAEEGPESDEARARLEREAASLSPAMAVEVVRAFTLYFQLVNLAEDVHRTRELRRREMHASEPVAESFRAVMAQLSSAGASREQVLSALRDVRITYVFTAHPTEARRRTTERLLSAAREVLEHRDRRRLTPEEFHAEDRRLRACIEALWEHASERRERPEVLEEVKAGLWYLRHVLLDVVPRVQRRLVEAVDNAFGPVDPLEMPMCIAFGSWMGSDRDGNPYVTDAVTERTLDLHRWIVVDRYLHDLDQLVDPLSGVRDRLPRSDELEEAMARAAAAVPEVVLEAERRNPDEPLRRFLTFIRERVERTRTFSSGAYPRPQAFIDDLLVIRKVLRDAHAGALPDDALLDLVQRVRCFGFNLAALDVREDSAVHRRVVAELLGDPDYPNRSEVERRQALQRLALPERGRDISPDARRVLDCFDTIRRLQARFGPEAIGTYVISRCSSATDVLEVLVLAELHHIEPHLDVVPLLETPEDLARAGPLLDDLLGDPAYRRHVRRRGDLQELLVGYSDSMKVGGILASRVRVKQAQVDAAGVCREHGVTLRVFHGRGGSVSRGGGPTYRAIGALPREAFSGQMKITEQGEMRAYNFANPDLAVRYLEQTLGAALVARYEARNAPPPAPADEGRLLGRLAELSQRTYQSLVGDPKLVAYFREATPFDQIAALNIASRPSKRRDGAPGLSDLRAIPWVFSWSQSRHVLTGWFGVGSAFEALLEEEGGEELLRRMYRDSPFLHDLVENVEMTLAKADMHIASRYATLCSDEAVAKEVFRRIEAEFARTCRVLLRVTGQAHLLEDDPVLERSIRLRNPYVDSLSYLQVQALRHARADDADRETWQRAARIAVQGIAAGLRHTG